MDAFVAGLIVVIVLGVVVILPPVAAAASQTFTLNSGVAFSVTTEAGTFPVWVSLLLEGLAAAGLVMASLAAANQLAGLDAPEVGVDPVTGGISIVPQIIDQMYDRGAYEDSIDPNEPSEVKSVRRQLIRAALASCVATMTTSRAIEIAEERELETVIPEGFIVDTVHGHRHVCEVVKIYFPGSHGKLSGSSMMQSTAHINEVLFDTEPVATATHEGKEPQTSLPRPSWMYLNYRENAKRVDWYRREDYGCKASRPNACDEWPWYATQQGGQAASPTPHLRIIDGVQNSVGGRDYQRFFEGCNLNDGEGFVVYPVPNFLLVDWSSIGIGPAPVPSTEVCIPQ